MKKIFTILLIAIFAIGNVEARKLISFGPRVGANFNFASGGDMLKPGNVGYNFGAFIEVRPIKFLSVSADVMYSKEGFKVETNYQGVGSTLDYNLGYLNIPILANFYVWKGFNIKAGIQPSIKLSGKVGLTEGESSGAWDQLTNNIKNGAFSIPVGIGYTFSWGLTMDLRYNIGLTNNVDNPTMDGGTSPLAGSAFKSQVLTLMVGWAF